jgi:hypothetical protein
MAQSEIDGADGLTQLSTPRTTSSSGKQHNWFLATPIGPSRALWLCSLPEFDMPGTAKRKSGGALAKQGDVGGRALLNLKVGTAAIVEGGFGVGAVFQRLEPQAA